MIMPLPALTLTGALLAQNQPAKAQHHGFTINITRIEGANGAAAVKRQIEVVESVGLSEETLKFFRTVPIQILADSAGTPGLYSRKNNRVASKNVDLAPNKPLLLHEFLHAYHDQILPDSVQSADVLRFYQAALTRYRMNKSEYFLSNEKEFFAVTASIYLHGSIKRPPFDRKTIQDVQPLCWKFLEGLFGPRNPLSHGSR